MILHKSKKDILNGNITEQILLFTIPIAGSYLIQQLYQFVDSIVLGRCASTQAMAAVGGSATMFINILLNIITGIATGSMILVGQSYGKGNVEKIKDAIKTGMFIAFVFGGNLSIISIIIAKPLMIIMKVPEDILSLSISYLYIYLLGLVPYMVYTIGNYILRATGDSKSSLFFTIIIAIVKILLDILLVAVLDLGVYGVGISTVVSYLVCAVIVLLILKNTPDIYQYSIRNFGFDLDLLKQTFKVGAPIAIQSAVFAITTALVSVRVNEFGTLSVAAYSAYNNVDNFYWSFANAIGAAVLTIVSQNYGNKNIKRVKQILKHGIIMLIVVSVVVGTFDYFVSKYILKVFTSDQEVINIAYKMTRITGIMYNAYVPLEIISSTIKGCGDTLNSMIIAIIGICVVRFAYLTQINFTSVYQVMWCFPISWIITSIMYTIYYLLNKKYLI